MTQNEIAIKTQLTYVLLLLSLFLAVLALTTSNFLFKSGTAGIGILIILILQYQKKGSKADWWIAGAYFFSILGDWFLTNMQGDSMMFVKGIALFFLAHVGYLSFALINGKMNWRFTSLLLASFLTFFFLALQPAIDDQMLMIAALIYLLVSCFSMGAAIGSTNIPIVKWSYFFGILLILLSDTIISFKEFVGYHAFDFLILPTYYLAHISITFSLINKAERT